MMLFFFVPVYNGIPDFFIFIFHSLRRETRHYFWRVHISCSSNKELASQTWFLTTSVPFLFENWYWFQCDAIWFDSTRNEKESNHQTVCVCCQNRNNVGNKWLDLWLKVAISFFLLKLYGPSCLYSDEVSIIGFPKHCSVLCGLDRQTESHEKRPSKGRWTCVFCVNLS